MSPGPSETNTAQELLRQFSNAQRIRALKYKQLEKGFEAVLHTHHDADYKYADKLTGAPTVGVHIAGSDMLLRVAEQ